MLRLEQNLKNGGKDEINFDRVVQRIAHLHQRIKKNTPYKNQKIELKRWMLQLVGHLEPIFG